MKTLVLDSTYKPIRIIDWQDAFILYFKEKAEILEVYADKFVNSVSKVWNVPAVIRVKTFVQKTFNKAKYSRKNVFVRDKGFCQYCAEDLHNKAWTIDHVIPRAQGGKSEWTNVVVCCKVCNQLKGDRTPEEAGMKLLQKPAAPFNLSKKHQGHNHDLWLNYLW